jgi:hypothetical protein
MAVGVASAMGLAGAGPGALVPLHDLLVASAQVSVAFVVDFGARGVVKSCVHVPAGTNGYGALTAFTQQENEEPPTYNQSGLLCSINGVPSSGCGQSVPGGYVYWAYFHGNSGSWQYASSGASGAVSTGDVEGWRFEDPGAGNPTDPPPRAAPAFTSICGTTSPTSAPGTMTTSAVPPVAVPRSGDSSPPPVAHSGAGPSSEPQGATGTTAPTSGPGTHAATSTSLGSRSETPRSVAAARRRSTSSSGGNALTPLLATGAVVVLLAVAAVFGWRRRAGGP